MCGIGLLLQSPPIHLALDEQDLLLPFDSNATTEDNNNTSTITAAYEKCLMESIAPRGPDLPYSKKQFSILSNGGGDGSHESVIKSSSPPNITTTTNIAKEIKHNNIRTHAWTLNLYTSVLHMRGSTVTPQPYMNTKKIESDENNQQYYNYAFCWNGECYSYYKNHHHKVDSSLNSDTKLSTTTQDANRTSTNLIQILDAANEEETRSDTKVVMEGLKHTIESLYQNNTPTNCHVKKDILHEMHASDSRLNDCDGESTMNTFPAEFRKQEHLAIAEELGHVHGEYSFILYCIPGENEESSCDLNTIGTSTQINNKNRNTDKDQQYNNCDGSDDAGRIYFGRDRLGRRSLLMTDIDPENENDECHVGDLNTPFIVSSMALTRHRWGFDTNDDTSTSSKTFTEEEHIALDKLSPLKEIAAGRVYCLDLNTMCLSYVCIPALPPYSTNIDDQLEDVYRCTDPEKEMMKTSIGTPVPSNMIEAADRLHAHLDKAVRRRVLNAPLMKRQSTATSNTSVYSNSDDGKSDTSTRKEASVAILFSGGVDSVVLAALSHNHVPINEPIDLINVAFAAKKPPNISKCPFESTPDRQAALLSFQEMKRRWPNREWRLIGVDTNYSEVLQYEDLICGLISPLSSTMDFNIGTAFWFSSRGSGINQHVSHNHCYHQSEHLRFTNVATETESMVHNHDNTNISDCKVDNTIEEEKTQTTEGPNKLEDTSPQYEKDETICSSARVLLIGIGADEMMAGYGRFRNVYNKGGYDALREELKKDKDRLWTRNLGKEQSTFTRIIKAQCGLYTISLLTSFPNIATSSSIIQSRSR